MQVCPFSDGHAFVTNAAPSISTPSPGYPESVISVDKSSIHMWRCQWGVVDGSGFSNREISCG